MSTDDESLEEPSGVYVDEAGTEWPAMSREGDWPDFASLAGNVPFDKAKDDYSAVERRAELYKMIEQVGHPKNMEQSQASLGERFGVSQQQISEDMQILKEYVAAHDTTRAKSVVGWLSEKTVAKHVEAAERMEEAGRLDEAADRYEQAQEAHLRYIEYLVETGEMESADDTLHVEGDAGEAYMAMLKQASETVSE